MNEDNDVDFSYVYRLLEMTGKNYANIEVFYPKHNPVIKLIKAFDLFVSCDTNCEIYYNNSKLGSFSSVSGFPVIPLFYPGDFYLKILYGRNFRVVGRIYNPKGKKELETLYVNHIDDKFHLIYSNGTIMRENESYANKLQNK
jgi:hypothetical protein